MAFFLCTLLLACVEVRIAKVTLTPLETDDDFSMRLDLEVGLDAGTTSMLDNDEHARDQMEKAVAIETLPVYLAIRCPVGLEIAEVSLFTKGDAPGGESSSPAGLAPQLARWFEREMPTSDEERWTVFHAMLVDVGPASERSLGVEVALGDIPTGETLIHVSPGYFGDRWEFLEPTPPTAIRVSRDRTGATARMEDRPPSADRGHGHE